MASSEHCDGRRPLLAEMRKHPGDLASPVNQLSQLATRPNAHKTPATLCRLVNQLHS